MQNRLKRNITHLVAREQGRNDPQDSGRPRLHEDLMEVLLEVFGVAHEERAVRSVVQRVHWISDEQSGTTTASESDGARNHNSPSPVLVVAGLGRVLERVCLVGGMRRARRTIHAQAELLDQRTTLDDLHFGHLSIRPMGPDGLEGEDLSKRCGG